MTWQKSCTPGHDRAQGFSLFNVCIYPFELSYRVCQVCVSPPAPRSESEWKIQFELRMKLVEISVTLSVQTERFAGTSVETNVLVNQSSAKQILILEQ